MKKITQKQCVFYKLYFERKKDKKRFIPTWEFGGEMLIEELNRWVLMTYKAPARLSDIYNENPRLLERELIRGKSGSNYFGYRLREEVNPHDIEDKALYDFYQSIKNGAFELTVRNSRIALYV